MSSKALDAPRVLPLFPVRLSQGLVLGAIVAGLLLRIPGVFWGFNYPTGWAGHHIDEFTHTAVVRCVIDPARNPCPAYPKGLAVHIAVPLMLLNVVERRGLHSLWPDKTVIVAGRMISALYGALTIYLVFLLALRLFADPRIPVLAAWLFAISNTAVTQSHFFLADVPMLFWLLLALYCVARELEATDRDKAQFLYAAAASLGVAFGLKLNVYALPSLLAVALLVPPRLGRSLYAGLLFVAGFSVVTLCNYSPSEVLRSLHGSVEGGASALQRARTSGMYLLEIPGLVSFPICILAIGGMWRLLSGPRKLRVRQPHTVALVVALPALITAGFVIFKLDHFPRHLLPFVPWIAMMAAVGLTTLLDRVGPARAPWVLAAIGVYLTAFVYDGQRQFIAEPRNRAAQWLLANVRSGAQISWYGSWWGSKRPVPVPGYRYTRYPAASTPAVIVAEMHFANYFLSGMGLRNSFPADYRIVFGADSQRDLEAWQGLFRGSTSYKVCSRFPEQYFMPEYVLTDRLLGNRSSNYLAEVVMFCREDSAGGWLLRGSE